MRPAESSPESPVEIHVDSVSVEFPIYDANARSLRNTLVSFGTGGAIRADARRRVTVTALEGVSFSLREGDRLGIVGHNGAGKTTLLRVLAGIYEPTRGSVLTRGQVAPLFDIMLGMDPDATGYENIRIRGLFLSLSRSEIEECVDDIAHFSELGPYMEMPIRTYSSGMRVRLAFAIATALQPDILLLDEMIGAGDARFIERAERRLGDFLSRAQILVLSSHSTEIVRKMCNKALLLHNGKAVGFDSVDEILKAYESLIRG
jgi:ABC-2 type transport system ATP-binding protein/lipopolysaccharide transport system ATP-binding protein